MFKSSKILPIIIFFILSSVIVFPLLSPGFIMTMDIAFTPKIPPPALSSPSFLFSGLLWILNKIISAEILEKIMLFGIFFLSGWSMFGLLSKKIGWIGLFGGFFYAVNPFVYERVMAGQWQLLLGYAIFPLLITAVFHFYETLNLWNAVKLSVLSTIVINLGIHFSLIIAVFFLIYGVSFLFFHSGKLIPAVRNIIFAGLVFIILNLNWLLPVILGQSSVLSILNIFDKSDLAAFQSVADPVFGLVFNLFSGFGFWPEANKYFLLSKDIIFFWPVISLLFIAISGWGFILSLKDGKKTDFPVIITLSILLLISLDLAGGVALKSSANIFYFLYDLIPPLRGFREPQKLVGMIMLFYGYFGSVGLYYLLLKLKENLRLPVLAIFFLLPFLYTPTVFGSFWGQLKPVYYPNGWFEVNKVLYDDKDNFNTVFFPWHQYTRFKFNRNLIVTNPALYFFDKPVISSQNYETVPLYTHDTRTEALHVEGLLSIENEGVNLLGDKVDQKISWGEDLTPINVKYIILAKDDDWFKYKFLDRQADLKKVYENGEMILYRNLQFGKETNIDASQGSEKTDTTVNPLELNSD